MRIMTQDLSRVLLLVCCQWFLLQCKTRNISRDDEAPLLPRESLNQASLLLTTGFGSSLPRINSPAESLFYSEAQFCRVDVANECREFKIFEENFTIAGLLPAIYAVRLRRCQMNPSSTRDNPCLPWQETLTYEQHAYTSEVAFNVAQLYTQGGQQASAAFAALAQVAPSFLHEASVCLGLLDPSLRDEHAAKINNFATILEKTISNPTLLLRSLLQNNNTDEQVLALADPARESPNFSLVGGDSLAEIVKKKAVLFTFYPGDSKTVFPKGSRFFLNQTGHSAVLVADFVAKDSYTIDEQGNYRIHDNSGKTLQTEFKEFAFATPAGIFLIYPGSTYYVSFGMGSALNDDLFTFNHYEAVELPEIKEEKFNSFEVWFYETNSDRGSEGNFLDLKKYDVLTNNCACASARVMKELYPDAARFVDKRYIGGILTPGKLSDEAIKYVVSAGKIAYPAFKKTLPLKMMLRLDSSADLSQEKYFSCLKKQSKTLFTSITTPVTELLYAEYQRQLASALVLWEKS